MKYNERNDYAFIFITLLLFSYHGIDFNITICNFNDFRIFFNLVAF